MAEVLAPGLSIFWVTEFGHITTQNGRPIGELNAFPTTIEQAKAHGIYFRTGTLKIPDCRFGIPGNVSAYGDMMKHYQPVLDGMAWLNLHFFEGRTPSQITKAETLRLANLGRYLPMYLLHQSGSEYTPEGSLPNVVGDIFKASAGIRFVYIAQKESEGFTDTTIVTPESTYDRANRLKLFVVKDQIFEDQQRACPAPYEIITQTIQSLFFGTGGNPNNSELGSLSISMERLKLFSDLANGYDVWSKSMESTLLALGEPTWNVREFLERLQVYRLFEDRSIKGLTAIQTEINQVINRNPAQAPRIDHQALVKEFGPTPIELIIEMQRGLSSG